eukprot:CAMPEP_0198119642 /NCGR_PEP_ID=MMETSP1442-20131203/26468_1 /TAXON_ID= /ORGANISM="Craspedostauros australis, Strain CCMP3328" /LENGTH=317 /DNA_ID=CAMNT_0043778157 /DNA_START=153 /DNA_END=1106 /DNA_ORIENTATION=+
MATNTDTNTDADASSSTRRLFRSVSMDGTTVVRTPSVASTVSITSAASATNFQKATQRETPREHVLVIGGRGPTGVEIIRQLSTHPAEPSIYAFCHNTYAPKGDPGISKLCSGVIEGNASSKNDLENAIQMSQATTIIVSFCDVESMGRTDLRSTNAKVLSEILKQEENCHIQVMVLSVVGAGPTTVYGGRFGTSFWKKHKMRFVLVDHTLQELAFQRNIGDRVAIIRTTALRDEKARGKVRVFGDYDKTPRRKTNRKDLALWLIHQIYDAAETGTRKTPGSSSPCEGSIKMTRSAVNYCNSSPVILGTATNISGCR